ncbi:MAG: hypothetical protein ACK5Q5_10530, partial [Planctomycetaceae bacterium]
SRTSASNSRRSRSFPKPSMPDFYHTPPPHVAANSVQWTATSNIPRVFRKKARKIDVLMANESAGPQVPILIIRQDENDVGVIQSRRLTSADARTHG